MISSAPQAPRAWRSVIAFIALTALLVVGPVAERRASAGDDTSATGTTLEIAPSSSIYGETVTLTATVVSAGVPVEDGTVAFIGLEGATLGTVSLNAEGVAVLIVDSLSVGAYELYANYNGTSDWSPSSGGAPVFVSAAPTATTLTSSPNPSAFGETVTFTAQVVADPSSTVAGEVGFFDESNLLTPIGVAPVASGSCLDQHRCAVRRRTHDPRHLRPQPRDALRRLLREGRAHRRRGAADHDAAGVPDGQRRARRRSFEVINTPASEAGSSPARPCPASSSRQR